jgi:hypothetical protein
LLDTASAASYDTKGQQVHTPPNWRALLGTLQVIGLDNQSELIKAVTYP